MNPITKSLSEGALHDVARDRGLKIAVGIAAFVLATSVGAYVAVPLPWTPVPMTLQPLVVILAGAVLGPRAGAAAMATYVLLGAAGAPVFSGGHSGLAWLVGPTGGYLLAFPVAAFVVGAVAGPRDAGRMRVLLALVTGIAVIYAGGLSQLHMVTGQGLSDLLRQGALPFLGGDLVKVLIALVLAGPLRSTSLGRS